MQIGLDPYYFIQHSQSLLLILLNSWLYVGYDLYAQFLQLVDLEVVDYVFFGSSNYFFEECSINALAMVSVSGFECLDIYELCAWDTEV